MNYSIRTVVIMMSVLAVPATALAADDAQCRAAASQATGYTPGAPPQPVADGDRVRGAARGAAAGAVVGGAQANQYDRAPDALQDQHRQNQARSGAAAGVAVAGSRNRQERRSNRRSSGQQQAAWQSSYDACMRNSASN